MSQDAGAESSKRPRGAEASSSSSGGGGGAPGAAASAAPPCGCRSLPEDVARHILAFSAPLPPKVFELRWSSTGALRAIGLDWAGAFVHEAQGVAAAPELHPRHTSATFSVDTQPTIVHGLRVWRTQEGRARAQRSVTLHGAAPSELTERARLFFSPSEGGTESYAESCGFSAAAAERIPPSALQHTFWGQRVEFGDPSSAEVRRLVKLAVVEEVAAFWHPYIDAGAHPGAIQFHKFSVTSTNSLQPRFQGSSHRNNGALGASEFFGDEDHFYESREAFFMSVAGVRELDDDDDEEGGGYAGASWRKAARGILVSSVLTHVPNVECKHVAVIMRYLDTVLC